jgi:hypothetical protein
MGIHSKLELYRGSVAWGTSGDYGMVCNIHDWEKVWPIVADADCNPAQRLTCVADLSRSLTIC